MATDLLSHISLKESECLNETKAHCFRHCIENGLRDDENVYLESDVDEQLLIYIPFIQAVKAQAISIRGPADRAPSRIKVFLNRKSLDFNEAEDETATQVIELQESDVTEGKSVLLKGVKFQKVNSLTLFVSGNLGDSPKTVITRLAIFGSANDDSKMDVSKIQEISKQQKSNEFA
eukprot:TRINITY_DN2927_c5_g3::TRINITY_DN2927_c5_g3_i6::g.4661::m.4661 TRINITY_DN2927_c5_g3::TRINITY_DN2927_c5_g3_i6::g.4661  ORF type:complete len:176 (+),score=28.58,sp/Q9SQZ9/PITH1_ARATH/40.26/1e-34,PITH/PF06201.8/2.5e-42 TRINITY_DN2927_c5_g3_i6:42-569(+)